MLVKDNPNIPKEDKDFFILLRVGLWQKVEEELSLCPDWNYIYKLACEQTVQGIIADGIGLYRKEHPDLNITQEQNDKFLSASAQIVRRNFAINQLQAKLCKLFEEQNIAYVILKGQVVAQCYPKPNLRCSGDIDFLIPSEESDDYTKTQNLLTQISDSSEPPTLGKKHQGFSFGDLEVEIHGYALSHFSKNLDNVIEAECTRIFKEHSWLKVNIADTKVPTPPLEFHTLFLVAHIFHHVFEQGIGLRQFCDLAVFLKKNDEKTNKKYLQELIERSEIQKQWLLISSFLSLLTTSCSDYFPKSTNEISETVGIKIWKDIKTNGNFGISDNAGERKFWSRNLYVFKKAHRLLLSRWKYSPVLALYHYAGFYSSYIKAGFGKIFHINGMKFNK